MENLGLLLIFWYGILHAFGPDHLTAIADFSIGKSKKKTMAITFAFAVGHGVMLFVFAKILQNYNIDEHLMGYGDTISSLVILGMGLFILFMVFTDRIQLKTHTHNGKEHIHIWYGKDHSHKDSNTASAFAIGALMGVGGVRGMLITLGLIENQEVNWIMIFMFVLGVSIVFGAFGLVILAINQNLLKNKQNIRRVFATIGTISIIVGSNMLLTGHSHAMPLANMEEEAHGHSHSEYQMKSNADELVASRKKSDMTYAQMMRTLGNGVQMMQEGILTQNKELVILGAKMIDEHPAPKTKPWEIVTEENVPKFKRTLIKYDKLLHDGVHELTKSVENEGWHAINEKVYRITNTCITCHNMWQKNLK